MEFDTKARKRFPRRLLFRPDTVFSAMAEQRQEVLRMAVGPRALAGDNCMFTTHIKHRFSDDEQTQALDDVHRTLIESTQPAVLEEGKKIVSQLGALKYEMQHDRPLT